MKMNHIMLRKSIDWNCTRNIIMECAKICMDDPRNRLLYNNVFIGYMFCGMSSIIMERIINIKHNIHTKPIIRSIGYYDHYEDHVFLKYNENTIIDPTHQQFLNTPDIYKNEELFIGSYSEFIQNMKELNQEWINGPEEVFCPVKIGTNKYPFSDIYDNFDKYYNNLSPFMQKLIITLKNEISNVC